MRWFAIAAGGFGAWLLYKWWAADDVPALVSAPPTLPPGATIVLIGDSLGVGLTPPLATLAGADGMTVIGRAKVSTRIPFWRDVMAGANWATPDLWLVSLGTNDCLLPHPESERDDLAELLELLGPNVVWIAPAPSPATPKLDVVFDMVKQAGATILYPPEAGYERGRDQIHATSAGYKVWAAHIWSVLKGVTQ